MWLDTQLWNLGEIRLILDGTKIGFGHQLLMVWLTYEKELFRLPLHGSGRSKDTVEARNTWLCWLKYAI
jgi:hypothetical protein